MQLEPVHDRKKGGEEEGEKRWLLPSRNAVLGPTDGRDAACNCVSGRWTTSLSSWCWVRIRVIYTKLVFFEDILVFGINRWHAWYSRSHFLTINVYVSFLKSSKQHFFIGIQQEAGAGRWDSKAWQWALCISGWPLSVYICGDQIPHFPVSPHLSFSEQLYIPLTRLFYMIHYIFLFHKNTRNSFICLLLFSPICRASGRGPQAACGWRQGGAQGSPPPPGRSQSFEPEIWQMSISHVFAWSKSSPTGHSFLLVHLSFCPLGLKSVVDLEWTHLLLQTLFCCAHFRWEGWWRSWDSWRRCRRWWHNYCHMLPGFKVPRNAPVPSAFLGVGVSYQEVERVTTLWWRKGVGLKLLRRCTLNTVYWYIGMLVPKQMQFHCYN